MRKIILYGELAKRFGREHNIAVKTAGEAITAMCVNFKGFKSMMRDAHKYGIGFKVFVGNRSLGSEKEIQLPSSSLDIIRITPAIFGSGGLVRTLIGVVLIVVGVVFTPISAGFSNGLTAAGVGLVLNGVYDMLSPVTTPSNADNTGATKQSFVFSGPENVTQQGGGVPVGYGRMMVGSTVISAGIVDADA